MFLKPKHIPHCRFICDFFTRQSSGSLALNSIFQLTRLAAAELVTPKWAALIHQSHPGAFGESANLHRTLAKARIFDRCPYQISEPSASLENAFTCKSISAESSLQLNLRLNPHLKIKYNFPLFLVSPHVFIHYIMLPLIN